MFSVTAGAGLVRGRDEKIPASPGCKPHWCCHCKVVVLGNGVQKAIKDLPVHIKVPNSPGFNVDKEVNCQLILLGLNYYFTSGSLSRVTRLSRIYYHTHTHTIAAIM